MRDFGELWSTFTGSTNFRQRISQTLFVTGSKISDGKGSGQSTLSDARCPNLVNFGYFSVEDFGLIFHISDIFRWSTTKFCKVRSINGYQI